jgi:flagellar hook protein FlgE
MYAVKTAGVGTWDVYASVDGTDPTNTGLATNALTFDTSGKLTGAGVLSANVNMDAVVLAVTPATPNSAGSFLTFDINFAESTQFGSAFGTNSLQQNGYTSGRLTGVSVASDGVVRGNYSNGQARNLGQVVLTSFTNPNGLTSLGGNQWAETSASGSALVGEPNTGTLGVLQSAAVEESNVDLTAELVNMITEQRNYQANAQSIKTQDQILQTLVNLR